MILFETDTSVFELMWDLGLAFFIIRNAFIYFILTYLSSIFLSYIRLNRLIPYNHLTAPARELIAFPIYILTVALWARTVIVYHNIPRALGFRISIGLVAGLFMVIAELVGGLILWEERYKEWIWETDLLGAALGILSLMLLEGMPWILMLLEKSEMREATHGHGQKSITAAVLMIGKTEKVEIEDKTVN
ncbi:51800bcc-c424-4602-ac62-9a4311e6f3d1 [Sclerotinia trifoliorum]|uniref:51800bcc-c424-4602-ac62-9a4311e6f3d1 n=1 Tax=Sclerotinia trifoliorum TaxID=28548 RepID=A0A8H2W3H7_9HELO|nr:51800bcc-c424-4602-ac62-9a4311e6f3d1 [Sclerotinia trifoliorum]